MIVLPSGSLADSIRYYLLTDIDRIGTHIPAMAAPTLVVFHSGGTRLCDDLRGRLLPSAFLSGPALSPRRSMADAGTRLVSVLFRPGQLQRFFDVDVRELADKLIPLTDAIGREADPFLDRVRETWNPAALITVTEQFLLDRARRQEARRHPRELVRVPAALLHGPLSELSQALGVGSRQFQRTFSEQYGLTLRDFRRVSRFERVLADVLKGPASGRNLGEVAQNAGYFDQAHFDRDFRAFTGYAPSQFRSLMGVNTPELWPFRFEAGELRALLSAEKKVASIQDR